ncbi:mannonate dehydratase [Paenibacillus koleovorans]|uniref:mannonate dehydratase n=1 Tax=Paenibacillus koleovorans TaxID=121608 RepID=UPI0027D8E2EB|nr:mannonate dehydratase [Paenibacillus koleovorans]
MSEVLSTAPDRLWQLARQAGVTGVVSRLPLSPDGRASVDYMDLLQLVKRYEDFGFRVEAFEPGYEWELDHVRIGTDKARRDEEIAACKRLIRHLGALGVPVLCYNFMARFNWVRTSLALPTRGGALVTGYDHACMKDAPLTDSGVVTEEQLWENLQYFLREVVPVAEQAGVRLALHPDDPPVSPIRGIARIITSAAALRQAIQLVPSEYSGITMCQGTLAAAGEAIPEKILEFGGLNRLFYVHFRDIRGTAERFSETFHDDGQTNMAEAVRAYRKIGFHGPVRVDHVPTMAGEDNRTPGYESMGRLFALGYLRGLLDGTNE